MRAFGNLPRLLLNGNELRIDDDDLVGSPAQPGRPVDQEAGGFFVIGILNLVVDAEVVGLGDIARLFVIFQGAPQDRRGEERPSDGG